MKLVRDFKRWPDGLPVTVDGIQRLAWYSVPDDWRPLPGRTDAIVLGPGDLRGLRGVRARRRRGIVRGHR